MPETIEEEAVAGWVVNWRPASDGGAGPIRFFLAAIVDRKKALEAVRRIIGGAPDIALVCSVNQALLVRRKVASGDVIPVQTKRSPSVAERARIARVGAIARPEFKD